jgi:hypothetical protein
MDFILVSLQTNQPPTGHTHAQTCHDSAEHYSQHSHTPASTRDRHAESSSSKNNQHNSQKDMTGPGVMTQMSAEDWK